MIVTRPECDAVLVLMCHRGLAFLLGKLPRVGF